MPPRSCVALIVAACLFVPAVSSAAVVTHPSQFRVTNLTLEIRCYGCSCRGGPGYRSNKTFNCVGNKQLKSACGEPPTTNCACELESCGFDRSKPRVKSAAELSKPARTKRKTQDVSSVAPVAVKDRRDDQKAEAQ